MIPSDWQILELAEVADFSNGKAHENLIDESGSFIVVNSKFISSDGQSYKRARENLCPLKANEIAMVMSDIPNGKALGKCFLVPEDDTFALNQRICSLRPQKADSKFLYYFLNRNRYFLEFDNGVGQTNLRKDEVLECPVYVPPLAEQRKIAEILSCWDEGISINNNLLETLEQFKFSVLNLCFGSASIVTAEEKEVGDFLEKIEGGGTPSRSEEKFWNGDIPWASVKDITKGNAESTIEYITQEGLKNSSSKLIPAGTVILVTRMAVGMPFRFSLPVAINQDLKALFPKPELRAGYLFYWAQFTGSRLASLGGGSTVNGIRLEQLRAQMIRVPDLEEQKRIEDFLGLLDAKLDALSKLGNCLKKQKQALMQKLLTGKVRVQLDAKQTQYKEARA